MNNSNFQTFTDSESSGNSESELETDETEYSSESSYEYYDKKLSDCSSNYSENEVLINKQINIEIFESETQSEYFESESDSESDSATEEEEIVLKKGFFTEIKNIIKEEKKKEETIKEESTKEEPIKEETIKEEPVKEETKKIVNDVSLNIIKDTQKENWQNLNYETITKDNFEVVITTSDEL